MFGEVLSLLQKQSKGRPRLHMFCLVFGQLPQLGKNVSSFAFHRARVARYSSRKHE